MTARSEGRSARDTRFAGASFTASAAGSIAFGVAYFFYPAPWLEGCALSLAFAGMAAGLSIWALGVLEPEQTVDERERFDVDDDLPPEAHMPRDTFLRRTLYVAAGALGLASLAPLRGLAPAFGEGLYHTKWSRGARVVDASGRPLRPDALEVGSVLTVFPEGATDDADSAALLIRLPWEAGAPAADADLRGCVAFSKICTHAGCPVGVYRRSTHQLLCPCHQSVFDVTRGAVPVSGPATKPLPQLPLSVGDDGDLRAAGDFPEPVGPGFWDRA